MIIGIGRSPLADYINKHYFNYDSLYAYPSFFDDKKLLLSSKTGYISYLKKLIKIRSQVRIALWPDYIPLKTAAKIVDVDLLRNITFIVPVHDLHKDIQIGEELEDQGFSIFYGYASDVKYRNYEIAEFLEEARDKKKWYLGVSTKRELHETLQHNFDGIDITGYLIASRNELRKDSRVLRRNLEELLQLISRTRGRQSSILEFLSINTPVYEVRV